MYKPSDKIVIRSSYRNQAPDRSSWIIKHLIYTLIYQKVMPPL